MLGVGILNTVFGYSIYAALLFFGATYLVALFIANAVGVIFNYYSVGRIVFQERGGWIIFGKFVATYAATYIANAIVLHILTIHLALNPYQGQLICLPLSISLNWTLLTFWAFKRRLR